MENKIKINSEYVMQVGSRNNTLLNYAMMLKATGVDYASIEKKVIKLNQDSSSPLKKDEVYSTVLKSVAQKMAQ